MQQNSTLRKGMRVHVFVPALCNIPAEEFVGTLTGINVPCRFSGLDGHEVTKDDGTIYHINPDWILPRD